MSWFSDFKDKMEDKIGDFADKIEDKMGTGEDDEDGGWFHKIPPAAINIGGRWLTPAPFTVSQEGDNVTGDSDYCGAPFTAEVHGFKITGRFGGFVMKGQINSKGDKIGWDNGASWVTYPEGIKSGDEVFLQSTHKRFLTIRGDGCVVNQTEAATEEEKLVVEKVGGETGEEILDGDKVCFKSVACGLYLQGDDDDVIGVSSEPNEVTTFKMGKEESDGVVVSGEVVVLKSHHRRYVAGEDDGTVTVQNKEAEWMEMWTVGLFSKVEEAEVEEADRSVMMSDRQMDIVVEKANAKVNVALLSESREAKLLKGVVNEINNHFEESLKGVCQAEWVEVMRLMMNDVLPSKEKKKRVHAIMNSVMAEPLTESLNRSVDVPVLGEGLEGKVLRKCVHHILKQMSNYSIEGVEKTGFA